MLRSRMRSRAAHQSRYEAYAHNHGMTSDQMRMHDNQCFPGTMLTPYLFWLNSKRFQWNQLRPEHRIQIGTEPIQFDHWLLQLQPTCDGLTCECHIGTVPLPDRH